MAMIEIKMIVACIARRYRLDVMTGHLVEPQPGTTMYPRYGMKMTLKRAWAAA
jgi:cytochrome P450